MNRFQYLDADATLSEEDLACLTSVMNSIRLAARITDMPCSEMNTETFIKVCSSYHYKEKYIK